MQVNKKSSAFPKNTEEEKFYPVVPPQFTATSRKRPCQVLTYLSSVTGTPVASYLRSLLFSALLRNEFKTAFSLSCTYRQLSEESIRIY